MTPHPGAFDDIETMQSQGGHDTQSLVSEASIVMQSDTTAKSFAIVRLLFDGARNPVVAGPVRCGNGRNCR